MLDSKNAIRKEHNTLIFLCAYIGCTNEVRCEKYASKLVRHSGYCRVHGHAIIDKPFFGTYNHFRDGVLRTNKKRNRHIEFNLSYEEFVFLTQIGTCHYCGEPNIEWHEFIGNGKHRYNLDRKNNTRGYTFDNVVVCCKECNMMKRDWFNADEFRALRLLLKRWREGTKQDRQELMYMLSSWNSDISVLM